MTPYIKRDIEERLIELAEDFPSILITGPRQVGKTRLLKHLFTRGSDYVNLDNLVTRKSATEDAQLFLSSHKRPLIIDEVQHLPEIFPYLKEEMDEAGKNGLFYLTGSAEYDLMRLSGESLCGRTMIVRLQPLSLHELSGRGELTPFRADRDELLKRRDERTEYDGKSLYERIWLGSLPRLASPKVRNRQEYLESYVSTFIYRDVRDVMPGVEQMSFLSFMKACAAMIGNPFNLHSAAVDALISDETAKRYLDVLETAGIVYFLHPYSNNLTKRMLKMPKLYFFDTGIVAYLAEYPTPETLMSGSLAGAILENFAINEIRKSYFNCLRHAPLYYYRDKDGREIDLLIAEGDRLYPIEIKKAMNPETWMASSFPLLKKTGKEVGTGLVLSLNPSIGKLKDHVYFYPVWGI